MVSRVKGRPALIKRLRGLLLAVHRFGRCRAATRADVFWTARLIDDLEVALTNAERHQPASPQAVPQTNEARP